MTTANISITEVFTTASCTIVTHVCPITTQSTSVRWNELCWLLIGWSRHLAWSEKVCQHHWLRFSTMWAADTSDRPFQLFLWEDFSPRMNCSISVWVGTFAPQFFPHSCRTLHWQHWMLVFRKTITGWYRFYGFRITRVSHWQYLIRWPGGTYTIGCTWSRQFKLSSLWCWTRVMLLLVIQRCNCQRRKFSIDVIYSKSCNIQQTVLLTLVLVHNHISSISLDPPLIQTRCFLVYIII